MRSHSETPNVADGVTATLPAHGSRLFRIRPTRATAFGFDATASSAIAAPGQSVTVTAILANRSDSPFFDTSAQLRVPSGWTVDPDAPVDLGTVAVGGQATASWTVTAHADASTGPVQLPVTASYSALGETRTAATGVTLTVPDASLASAFDNAGISNDTDTAAANIDGRSRACRPQALAAAGATPGATIDRAIRMDVRLKA